MRKIIIKTAINPGEKWGLSFYHSIKWRKDVNTIMNWLRRRLLASPLKEKVALIVEEYDGKQWENVNETLASLDPHYLLYAASCFLEDYLSKGVLQKIEREYVKKN